MKKGWGPGGSICNSDCKTISQVVIIVDKSDNGKLILNFDYVLENLV